MLSRKEIYYTLFLLIIYAVGIVGIALPLHPDFVKLTPLNLCVSLLVVFFYQEKWTKNLVFALLLSYFIGWSAEAIGIKYGQLFGDFYHYGDAMGWQVLQTPLTAGLLWVIVSSGTAALCNYAFKEKSWFWKSSFGALILVSLDILIEPVAAKLDFWQWRNQIIPLQNYVGWFVVGFTQLLVYQIFAPNFKNKIAVVLLIIQFIFFGIFCFFVK
jgi:uncharacterized membrane protein